jgi:hypothetical protein
MKLPLLLLLLPILALGLTGYQFEDNRSDKRSVPENGEMTFALPTTPSYIAACFSLYVKYNRYSSLVPIMDFRTNYQMDLMDFFYGSSIIYL